MTSTSPTSFADGDNGPLFFSRGSLGTVEFAFTNRDGGHSAGPFGALNLGGSSTTPQSDDPRLVERNLLTLAEAFDVPRVRTMRQVHGTDIVFIDAELAGSDELPVADAMITDLTGIGLVVRAADCTPVILADPQARLIGVVHAGRVGLAEGVAPAAVRAMRERGATRIQAWIGPRACGSCYELPQELVDEIAAIAPESRATTSWGTPAIDVGRGVEAQLRAEDVHVTDLGIGACTIEDEQFFSYRRQGVESGRQGGIVTLRAPGTGE